MPALNPWTTTTYCALPFGLTQYLVFFFVIEEWKNGDCPSKTITALAGAILDKELPAKESEWSHLDRYDDAIAGFGF